MEASNVEIRDIFDAITMLTVLWQPLEPDSHAPVVESDQNKPLVIRRRIQTPELAIR